MTLQPDERYRLALLAAREFLHEPHVRQELLRGLSQRDQWGPDESGVAVRLLAAEGDSDWEEQCLEKLPYGADADWDQTLRGLLRRRPELVQGRPERQRMLLDAYLEDRAADDAVELLHELAAAVETAGEAKRLIRQALQLLPDVADADRFRSHWERLKPTCAADPDLTAALKELCLRRRVSWEEALDVFLTWEAQLQAAWQDNDFSVSGDAVIEDKHRLLGVYLEAGDVSDVSRVLEYCARLDNLPLGIDVEGTIEKLIGFHDEAIRTFGEDSGLLLQHGDFCLQTRHFDDALKSYRSFRRGDGPAGSLQGRLERLIGAIKEVGEKPYLPVYLRAHQELVALLLQQGEYDSAQQRLNDVREYFFQVHETPTIRRLVDALDLAASDEARALQLQFLDWACRRIEQQPEDVGLLEDLSLVAYTLHDWEHASQACGQLVRLYVGQPEAARRIRSVYSRWFWSEYCRGRCHRVAMLRAVAGFLQTHRGAQDLDLDLLKEFCALGFHELALDPNSPRRDRAEYRRQAKDYYAEVMAGPTAPADRPYLADLCERFGEGPEEAAPFEYLRETPFEYLQRKYSGQVPYEIPLQDVEFDVVAEDRDLEKLEQLPKVGGFGQIYKARRRVGNRFEIRAIKMLKHDMPPEEMDRIRADFDREHRIMQSLNHPNCVKFYDAGVYDSGTMKGRQYIEMEFIDGTDLDEFINRRGAHLSLARKLKVFLQICAGVQYLHCQGKGIVHRDLHPRNVLLGEEAAVVKVADFGLARVLDDSGVAKSSRVMGRDYYVPPETRDERREGFTRLGDIYSLGMILCFMLTGRVPPHHKTLREKAGQGLTDVCEKATDWDPRRRYQSVTELLENLRELAADLPELDARNVGELQSTIDAAHTQVQTPLTLRELWERYTPDDASAAEALPQNLPRRDFVQVDVTTPRQEYLSLKFINTIRRDGLRIVNRIQRLQPLLSLRHPHVETIVAHGELETPPCCYVAYQRIPGTSLMKLIEHCEHVEAATQEVALPLAFALQAGVQMAEALAETHRHGIIHRMFSPAKVMVDLAGGVCVLTDFSAAVVKDQREFGHTAEQIGDVDFLAPEALGENPAPIDQRTDLYGLAATVTALLLGRKRARFLPDDHAILRQRHQLEADHLQPLMTYLDIARDPEPSKRAARSADEFKRQLLALAATVQVDPANICWKGIADAIHEHD